MNAEQYQKMLRQNILENYNPFLNDQLKELLV
jgi:hypothetical protein